MSIAGSSAALFVSSLVPSLGKSSFEPTEMWKS